MESAQRPVLLVVGDEGSIAREAALLSGVMDVVAFAPGLREGRPAQHLRLIGGRICAIAGRLGAYEARAAGPGGSVVDAGVFSLRADGGFDAVLDLGGRPLLDPAEAPLGYFAPRTDAERVIARECLPLVAAHPADAKPATVHVREPACTLCGACSNACPTTALRLVERTSPRLQYREAACSGCAACAASCPERALLLRPRRSSLPLRPEATLARAQPARCRQCGDSFGSGGVQHVTRDLAVTAPARRALELCPQCRSRALFAAA